MSHEWTPCYYVGPHVYAFLGDSITYRGETSPTYPQDFLAAVESGTTGSSADATSYAPYPYWTEGHGGETSTAALAALPARILSWHLAPTRAVLLIGVNDIVGGVISQATTLANIAAIRVLVLARAPAVDFRVGLLTPVADAYAAHQTAIDALNVALLAAYPTAIDFTGLDPDTMLVDGLHANALGSADMATAVRTAWGL